MTNEELKEEIENLRATVEQNWRGHVNLQDRWLHSTTSDRLICLEKTFKKMEKRINRELGFIVLVFLFLIFYKG